MVTMLNLFENFFQEELTLENLDRIQRSRNPEDWMLDLFEEEERFLESYFPVSDLSEKRKGFIDASIYFKNDVRIPYLGQSTHWSYDRLSRRILGYLLYYPAICIEWNKLSKNFGTLLKYKKYLNDKDYWKEESAGVLDQLRLLAVLRPFVELGDLEFFKADYFRKDLIDVWIANYADHCLDYLEFLRPRYPSNYTDPDLMERVEILSQQICGADLIGAYPIAIDTEMADLMEFHYQRIEGILSYEKVLQNSIAGFIEKMDLPNLISLDCDDLVRVRKDELVFAEWREDLAALMSRMNSFHIDGPGNTDFRNMVRDTLTPRKERMLESIKSTSLSNLAKENTIGFGLGVLGGLVVSGDVLSSVLSGIAGSALTMAKSILSKRDSKAEEVVLKWFSSFTD